MLQRIRTLLQWPMLIISGGFFWALMYHSFAAGDKTTTDNVKMYSAIALIAMVMLALLGLSRRGLEDDPRDSRFKIKAVDKASQEATTLFVAALNASEAKAQAEKQGLLVLEVSGGNA